MHRRHMIDYIIDHSTEVKDINYYLSLAYLSELQLKLRIRIIRQKHLTN